MQTRKQETRAILALMMPILATQLAQIGMGTIDTIISGHISTHDLAGVAIGTSVWLPIWLFMAGVLIALSPLSAKMNSAQQTDQLPSLLHSAIKVGVYLSCAMGALLILLSYALAYAIDDAHVAKTASDYLIAIAVGLPAAGYFLAYRFYAEATGNAVDATKVMLTGLVANAPISWLFANGIEGVIQGLGGVGCGVGTSLVFIFMANTLARITQAHSPNLKPPSMWRLLQQPQAYFGTILRVGMPIGVAVFFEVTLFSVISLFLTQLGAVAVAGHQVAINISSLTFMLPLSLSMALTVRVGHYLGQQNDELARMTSWLGVKINIAVALLNATLIVSLSGLLATLYSPDPNVVELAAHLLLFAAVFQISDAIQVAAAGALRGYQDTLSVMAITFVTYWLVGLSGGYWLAFLAPEPMGASGFWVGLVSGLSLAAFALSLRLRYVINQRAAAPNRHKHGRVLKRHQ